MSEIIEEGIIFYIFYSSGYAWRTAGVISGGTLKVAWVAVTVAAFPMKPPTLIIACALIPDPVTTIWPPASETSVETAVYVPMALTSRLPWTSANPNPL